MPDRIQVSFRNDEHSLYLQIDALPNKSEIIKDLLRDYLKSGQPPAAAATEDPKDETDFSRIGTLVGITVGEDVVAYGGECQFLHYVTAAMIQNRISSLRIRHPKEADEVIYQIRKMYPKIGEKIQ